MLPEFVDLLTFEPMKANDLKPGDRCVIVHAPEKVWIRSAKAAEGRRLPLIHATSLAITYVGTGNDVLKIVEPE